MCGRFTLTSPAEVERTLRDVLGDPALPDGVVPRYNIAPTQPALVVANRAVRALEWFRWGLVPRWADSLAVGSRMINARSESLSTRPAFREAFARRRCLVPADGFLEWRAEGKRRQPLWIRREPRAVFCFAGLWERWTPRAGDGPREPVFSFTILTTAASEAVAPVHDRMPVILEPEAFERWLDPGPLPPAALVDLVAPTDGLVVVPVSSRVNSPANEGPDCLAPPEQLPLF